MVNTARVEAAFGKNTENANDEKNEKVEDVEEHAFDVYEYEKEPNLCRMRHRNIEKEMDFAEKTILSKIEFKEEEKNLDDELMSWAQLRTYITFNDSLMRYPFLAVRGHTMVFGTNPSFFNYPFYGVTRAFSNVVNKGLFRVFNGYFGLVNYKFLHYAKFTAQLIFSRIFEVKIPKFYRRLCGVLFDDFFYYITYSTLRKALVERVINGGEDHRNSYGIRADKTFSTFGSFFSIVKNLKETSVVANYVRDYVAAGIIELVFYFFTKPLFMNGLSLTRILAKKSKTSKFNTLRAFNEAPINDDSESEPFDEFDDAIGFKINKKTQVMVKKTVNQAIIRFLSTILGYSLANILTQLLLYPVDAILLKLMTQEVIKMDVEYSGFFDCLIRTFKSGGASALYSGFGQSAIADLFCFLVSTELSIYLTKRAVNITFPSILKTLFDLGFYP